MYLLFCIPTNANTAVQPDLNLAVLEWGFIAGVPSINLHTMCQFIFFMRTTRLPFAQTHLQHV